MNKKEKRKHVRGIYVDRGSYQKEAFVINVKGGENWKTEKVWSSMPKGENVEYGCH